MYRRLASDLSANGARVVADVAMDALEPVLAAGLRDGSLAAVVETMAGLRALGAGAVVVSRAADPVVVDSGVEVMEVVPPSLEELNRRGAGDAMTGALAAGLARGMPLGQAVPLAVAAGALNVTRRALGTAARRHRGLGGRGAAAGGRRGHGRSGPGPGRPPSPGLGPLQLRQLAAVARAHPLEQGQVKWPGSAPARMTWTRLGWCRRRDSS